jgi:FkbM family methyltransferase
MRNILLVGWIALHRFIDAVGAFWRALIGNEYARRSYSQYGEDMILRAIFARYPSTYPGIYIDVGAHHPFRLSNTRYFYELGWRGICIDPLPGSERLFKRWRPNDIFVPAGVAETECELTYFMFDEPALNTFSEIIANENAIRLKSQQKVKVFPLSRIFNDYLPVGGKIDFLSVDVEGMDLEVLRSNDWMRYRPRIVLVEETTHFALMDIDYLEIAVFMKQFAYAALARTPSGLFFVDTHSNSYDGGSYLNLSISQ